MINRWTIERTVRSVERRKRARSSTWAEQDFQTAHDLVAIFDALRPTFPVNYKCLFDSLALIEFLARYRLFPTWAYGVEIEPFNAHCWVQEGDILFNDIAEEVRRYTPIMAV